VPARPETAVPVVAVVGRPNVGKSTLFNRFVGKRQAIVEDRARTTRDRMYGDAEWNGRRFVLVDTGGLEVDPADPIELKVQEQARLAIGQADVILFLVDAVSGLTPADLEAAELLRKATKPIIVAVNKTDNTQREADAAEFHSLGWDETYAISASHGRGTGDLLDAIVWALPPESDAEIARKAREVEADEWARDVAAGPLEPYVVGPDSETEDDDADQVNGTGPPEVEARWDAAIAAEADETPAAIAFVGRPNVGNRRSSTRSSGRIARSSRRFPGRPATPSTPASPGDEARSCSSTPPGFAAGARSHRGPPPRGSRRCAP
jgi:small GTP-binding protein